MLITTAWRNDNPRTIWNQLAARLGREPTDAEAAAEVKRILGFPPEPVTRSPSPPGETHD